MSARTPGPWEARRTGDRWEIVSGTANFEDLSGVVVGWVETSRPGYSTPRDAADAKVMAASPDLLDVAECILDAANDRILDRLGHELPPLIRAKLEAAIAKATK